MHQTYTHTRHSCRSAEQWQQIVKEWQARNKSAKQFCNELAIVYASFCQWRKRLTAQGQTHGPDVTPGFIDLAALAPDAPRDWEIVLSLGNGVKLKLRQR